MFVSQDAPRDDFSGVGLCGSLPVTPQFHFVAEWFSTRADNPRQVDRRDVGVGIGYRMPLNRTTDFVARIDFLFPDSDLGDDEGLRLGAGLRSQVAPKLELRGAIQYVDVYDGDLVVELGTQYAVSDAWAGFLELSEGDNAGTYMMGVRFDL